MSQQPKARRVKLHVRLQAPGPAEHLAVVGSHEALGCWNPADGLRLEWKGSSWMTQQPVSLEPCETVEFKFIKWRPGNVEWEEGHNRVMEVPRADLQLQGIFNGESMLHVIEYDELQAADLENVWHQRCEELSSKLKAQEEKMEKQKEEHSRLIAQRTKVAAMLRQEIQDALDEASRLQIETGLAKEAHVMAPDATLIPSPSFVSKTSSNSSSPRNVSQAAALRSSYSTDLQMKSHRHRGNFSSPRFSLLPKTVVSPPAQIKSQSPISQAGAVSQPERSQNGYSTAEARLAALNAARGASPASPCSTTGSPYPEECLDQIDTESPQPGHFLARRFQPASGSLSSASESRGAAVHTDKRKFHGSGILGNTSFKAGGYESMSTRFEQDEARPSACSMTAGMVASKEVEAAFASARARYSAMQDQSERLAGDSLESQVPDA
mmetsp:Transcript_98785/g.175913  ORF Transcript_98785/g.175913 Transcript_98785/m.175913 type:complete len:438 (+) Transcript_98785:123-1436(+)